MESITFGVLFSCFVLLIDTLSGSAVK